MKTFSSLRDLGKQSLQIFAGRRRDKRAREEVIRHKVRTIPSPVLQCPSCWFLLVLVPTDRQRGKTFKDRLFPQWFSHSPGKVMSICVKPTIRSS